MTFHVFMLQYADFELRNVNEQFYYFRIVAFLSVSSIALIVAPRIYALWDTCFLTDHFRPDGG